MLPEKGFLLYLTGRRKAKGGERERKKEGKEHASLCSKKRGAACIYCGGDAEKIDHSLHGRAKRGKKREKYFFAAHPTERGKGGGGGFRRRLGSIEKRKDRRS